MFTLANVFRLFLTLVVVAFVFAVYLGWPGAVGEPRLQVSAASGGPVDVLLDDGSGRFVFSPQECQGLIGALSRCSSTIEISNVGVVGEAVEFEYSIEAWADTNGVDSGDLGSRGDQLSDCFLVSLAYGRSPGGMGGGPVAGPWVGTLLEVGQSEPWTVAVRVRNDDACQGARTNVIIAVFASNDSAAFDDFRTPTATPTPEPTPTETPEPVDTPEPPEATEEPGEPAEPSEPTSPLPVPPIIDVTSTPTPARTPTPVRPTPAAPTAATPPAALEPPPPSEEGPPTIGAGGIPRIGATNFLTERMPGGFSQLSRDPRVLATNLTLSVAAVLVILAATTIFNATLKENADAIHRMTSRLSGPTRGVGRALGLVAAQPTTQLGKVFSVVKPLVVVLGTGIIYAMMEPSFGFNDTTGVLLVALLAGIAMTTFLYEGGQVLWSSKRYRTPASMRIYPIAIVIAVGSVLLTRVADLHPGIIFGFVAAAAVAPHGGVGTRERGMIVLVPVIGLLTTAIVAFMLIEPMRAYAESHPSVWGSLPETVAVALFVCGAQGTLMVLVPITFSDGEKIWQWNKLAWLLVAIPSAFLFFHVMVNTQGSFGDMTTGSRAMTALLISVGILAVAVAVWLYFRLVNSLSSAVRR